MSRLGQLERPSGLIGRLVVWQLNRANRGMNDLAFEALDVRDHGRVLEIGFGGGALMARLLAETRAMVVGLDLSTLAVQRAERRFADAMAAGRLTLHQGGETSLPFADDAFERVCCVNLIYFWRDLPAMLAEVRRVLKSGGRFVVCYEERAPDGTAFTTADVEAALLEAGFAMAGSRAGADRWNPAFHYTVGDGEMAGRNRGP